MNSILECSQRDGRARGLFFGEETMRFYKMFLYTLSAFSRMGRNRRGHYEEEECADAGCQA